MKTMLATLISISLIIIFPQSSQSFLDVGGAYGISWLKDHGTLPNVQEDHNNLWNWGSAPKGFTIYNNTVFPPGFAPLWYQPNSVTDSAPIIINDSAIGSGQTGGFSSLDPWLTAQLSGSPVAFVKQPKGVLL